MDTRFWGPSAWQLFHLIAFRSPHPDDVLNDMKDVLPCKFCRASTKEFTEKHPLRGDPGKWLYDIHNMVNDKLRTQCANDPAVSDPGNDPKFEEIKTRYAAMKATAVPGRDFLFSIAYNYPDKPEHSDMSTQREFLNHLAEAYPFPKMAKIFQRFMKAHEPALQNRKAYTRWMYGLLKELSGTFSLPTYRGYMHHVAYYKSGCSQKTYHGKTCRRRPDGSRTKDRDHRKTFRISHRNLL